MDLSVVNHEDYFAKIGDDHKFPINKFGELANYLVQKKIVKKFILELNTMTVEKNVEVNANDDATEYLIEKGFDAKLGARPLARIIDNEIKKPLSRMILFGDLQEGGRVEVTVVDKKLKINFNKPVAVKVAKPKKVNEKAPQ